jgi:uncharacterized coiled-coil protein SlyX
MTDRLDEIEIKLAHMELSVTELSDALYAQQRSLDRIERLCEVLQQRIDAQAGGDEPGPDNEIPPHY